MIKERIKYLLMPWFEGVKVTQWVALLHHISRLLGLILRPGYFLGGVSVHVLPVIVWVSSGLFVFLTLSKNMQLDGLAILHCP